MLKKLEDFANILSPFNETLFVTIKKIFSDKRISRLVEIIENHINLDSFSIKNKKQ